MTGSIATETRPGLDLAGYGRGYRAWMLFVLAAINALNLADRQGMASTAPAIKADLGLSDTQLGLIQGFGFAIFYTLLGLPMARLAERRSRARIVATSLGIFAVFVGLCGQARSFGGILLARVGVSVGDAGFGPPVASLVGDHFPAERRTSAMTWVWLGGPVGALIGSALGAGIAQSYGWRSWFTWFAVPSLLVAILAFVTLREPPRGRFDRAPASDRIPSAWETFRFLYAKRSMRFVIVGCAFAAMGMNGLGQFLVRFMVAGYHVPLATAGRTLGLLAVFGMASGMALGGFGVTALVKRDRRWAVWAPAIGLALATPLFIIGARQPSLSAALPWLAAAHVALFVYYTPTLALAQNMVGATMRASSAFVISFVLGMIGIGLGPTVIGILSDVFARSSFGGDFTAACPGGLAPVGSTASALAACEGASRYGILAAIVAMSFVFVIGAAFYLLAARDLRRDLDTHYEG